MAGNDAPIFAAELTPHRSLGLKGFKVLFLIFGLMSIVHGFVFLIIGAWPVFLFFGLDFLGLFVAFGLNYRAAYAREEVSVSHTCLSVRKFTPSGHMTEHRFNPFWARFRVARHQDIGIVSMSVSGQGRQTDVGSFLNRDDRESFASALTAALAEVKR